MSFSQTIRDWLAANEGPHTAAEIATGINAKRSAVSVTIGEMKRTHILLMHGDAPPFSYTIGRIPQVNKYATEEERRAARRATDQRAQERRKLKNLPRPRGAPSQAKRAEAREAKRLARERYQAAQKLAVQQRRDAKRAEMMARIEAAPAKKKAAVIPGQSVDEWLANGGQVERLDHGAGSKFQLQFIVHRGANDAAWRQRVTA